MRKVAEWLTKQRLANRKSGTGFSTRKAGQYPLQREGSAESSDAASIDERFGEHDLDPGRVLVEGLLLQTSSSDGIADGFIERYCYATSESFVICSFKGAIPQATLHFADIQEVRQEDRDIASQLATLAEHASSYQKTSVVNEVGGDVVGSALRSDFLMPCVIRKQRIRAEVIRNLHNNAAKSAFDAWKDFVCRLQDYASSESASASGLDQRDGAKAHHHQNNHHDLQSRRLSSTTASTIGEESLYDVGSGSDASSVSSVSVFGTEKAGFTLVTRGSTLIGPQEFNFLAANEDTCGWWLERLRIAVEHQERKPVLAGLAAFRHRLHADYHSDRFQMGVACFIFLNFVVQAIEAQVLPQQGSQEEKVFHGLEVMFLCIFMIELSINFCANFFWPFIRSTWNWFDLFVIGTSVWSSASAGSGHTAVLRLLRAGRVMRFFTRMPSLRKIILALYASIPAMLNAMLLTGIVMCMYGVLGVSFFQDHGNFHAFDVAVFTLFQASTGDGWSDIVRELYVEPGRAGSSITNLLVTCYFISYMLIVSFILIQVVIAVLLDEFSKVSDAEDLERSSARLLSAGTNFSVRPNPFVALVQDLSLCRDEASQRHMIHQVFDAVASAAGKPTKHALVTFRELVQGLRALDMRPPALFSRHDWHEMVVLPGLCDNRQRLGRAGFTALVSNCLHSHLVSELSLALAAAQSGSQWNDQAVCSLLSAVKVLLLDAQIKARGQHHHGHTHHHGHAHHHKPHGHSHETPHAPSAGEAPSLAQQVAEMRAAVMQLSSDVTTSRQHERAARQELADTVGELARSMASVVSEVARLSSYHQLKPVAADETNGRLVSRTDRSLDRPPIVSASATPALRDGNAASQSAADSSRWGSFHSAQSSNGGEAFLLPPPGSRSSHASLNSLPVRPGPVSMMAADSRSIGGDSMAGGPSEMQEASGATLNGSVVSAQAIQDAQTLLALLTDKMMEPREQVGASAVGLVKATQESYKEGHRALEEALLEAETQVQ